MNKKLLILIGVLVGVFTPLTLFAVYEISPIETLKTFFSFLHFAALITVIMTDIESKARIQKALMLLAFLTYPILLTADSTQIFDGKTFIIVFATAWIYLMGFAGWLYSGNGS